MYLREHRRRRQFRALTPTRSARQQPCARWARKAAGPRWYRAMQGALGDDDGTIKGIDVSQHNGVIDWDRVRAAGIEYAFINAGDGLYPDAMFETNWAGAGRAGILRSAYHFFRPALDADVQTKFFLGRLATVGGPGELPPAIDIESADGQPAQVITARVRRWIELVKAATGRAPIFYSTYYFWRDDMGAPDLSSSPLWLAQVTSTTAPFLVPEKWPKWTFWQWSWTGRIDGINTNVDVDRFNGTRAELRALGGGGSMIVFLALIGVAIAATLWR